VAIAGALGNGSCGYIVGTYEGVGTNNQRLYLNGAGVAQMGGTLPVGLNSAALGIGRHVSGVADPVQRKHRRVPHRPTSSAPTAGSQSPHSRRVG
jgi:hypothetical protein